MADWKHNARAMRALQGGRVLPGDEYRVSRIDTLDGRVLDSTGALHARAARDRVFDMIPLLGEGEIVVVEPIEQEDN